MGQYYYGVILNRETRKPMVAEDGYKLLESGGATMMQFAYELSKAGRCYMQRVTWAGDYSERKDYEGRTLYDYLSGDDDNAGAASTLPEPMDNLLPKHPSHDCEDDELEKAMGEFHKENERVCDQYLMLSEWQVRPELRYLCNHDRREYYDVQKFCDYLCEQYKIDKRYDGYENPLAILTSDPTCRIKGGGDYFYREGFEYYGTWSDCVISAESDVPDGYKEVKTLFEGHTRIWDPDTICQMITGEKYGYSLSSPSAYDFGRTICNYDERHCRLACVSRETILHLYADWQKKVDCERVYKAYDLLMRAIKKDPLLEQEHKGLKLDVRKHPCNDGTEYSDTYAIVDEVEMRLYGPYDSKWKCGYSHQASLYGIKYDCDLKSRRYFRNLVKERQAVGK